MIDMYQSNFEKLKVWEKAHQFALLVHKVTKKFPKEEVYGLTSQLRRAVFSVPTNIVEGNERKSRKEYIQFLSISKGSLAETKYLLIVSRDLKYINDSLFDNLNEEINNIGKLLNGLINYLEK
ncbi:four helix bundle protein [Candidatus Microgenomates bacterium]|nr:MAG: four helix bundle protein [Candidatus Microgenomates bacterium]